MTDKTKTCFVIAPIGNANSPDMKRSDDTFKYIFEPATKECGYTASRADRLADPGRITDQIIQHILHDDLVIADLSGHNPNVFYELAACHAFQRPFVLVYDPKETLPFDVFDLRSVPLVPDDLDSSAKCKGAIVAQIRAVESNPAGVKTPIGDVANLEALTRSASEQDAVMAQIVRWPRAVSRRDGMSLSGFQQITGT